MASIRRVSETNKEPTKAVLTAEKQKGVRTIYVDNLDGWRDGTNEDTAVPFVMYSKNLTTNEVISGSKTSWLGVVSKSSKTITNLTLTGGEDQLYPAGTAVVATPTAQWANDLADALLTAVNGKYTSPAGNKSSGTRSDISPFPDGATPESCQYTTPPTFFAYIRNP